MLYGASPVGSVAYGSLNTITINNYNEDLSFLIVSDISLIDLQQFQELLNFVINNDISLTDLQSYLDSLNFIINSNISLTDIASFQEVCNLLISSQVSILDIQDYLENLFFLIVSVLDEHDQLTVQPFSFKIKITSKTIPESTLIINIPVKNIKGSSSIKRNLISSKTKNTKITSLEKEIKVNWK